MKKKEILKCETWGKVFKQSEQLRTMKKVIMMKNGTNVRQCGHAIKVLSHLQPVTTQALKSRNSTIQKNGNVKTVRRLSSPQIDSKAIPQPI